MPACLTLTSLLPYRCAGGAAAGSWDSKAEWVRCMKLSHSSQIYLSTNQGCFYSLHPTVDRCSPSTTTTATTATTSSSSSSGSSGSQPAWRLLYSSPSKAAITCMQILDTDRQLQGHGVSASAMATHAAGGPKGNTRLAVLSDGVGVVTCLEVDGTAESQSNATVASEHSQDVGFGLHPKSRQSSAAVQDGTLQGAHTPSSRDSVLNTQASDTQDSGVQSQATLTGENSGPAECVTQQPEQHAPAKLASPLPRFSWVAHPGSPVLAIFHPATCGPRHVFTTSIAGAPMKWWLLPEPEPATSSAATSQEAETQGMTQSDYATSSAATSQVAETRSLTQPEPATSSAAPGQEAETQGMTRSERAASSAAAGQKSQTAASSLNPHTSSAASGEQLSRGQTAPQLLAEVAPIPGRGSQIVAADACWSRRLLVCGDMAGNVMAYSIPDLLLQHPSASGECDFQPQS